MDALVRALPYLTPRTDIALPHSDLLAASDTAASDRTTFIAHETRLQHILEGRARFRSLLSPASASIDSINLADSIDCLPPLAASLFLGHDLPRQKKRLLLSLRPALPAGEDTEHSGHLLELDERQVIRCFIYHPTATIKDGENEKQKRPVAPALAMLLPGNACLVFYETKATSVDSAISRLKRLTASPNRVHHKIVKWLALDASGKPPSAPSKPNAHAPDAPAQDTRVRERDDTRSYAHLLTSLDAGLTTALLSDNPDFLTPLLAFTSQLKTRHETSGDLLDRTVRKKQKLMEDSKDGWKVGDKICADKLEADKNETMAVLNLETDLVLEHIFATGAMPLPPPPSA
ncbi:hypothetical protein HDU96_005862 [Phlyctochytrium bullatum]|nr:hypothetical protein HDU96_005862 [Phlyctochytrium bullatum]